MGTGTLCGKVYSLAWHHVGKSAPCYLLHPYACNIQLSDSEVDIYVWTRYLDITRNAMLPKCRGDIKIFDENVQTMTL